MALLIVYFTYDSIEDFDKFLPNYIQIITYLTGFDRGCLIVRTGKNSIQRQMGIYEKNPVTIIKFHIQHFSALVNCDLFHSANPIGN